MVAALRNPTAAEHAVLRRKLGDKLCWRLNKTAPRSEDEARMQREARHAAKALVKSTRADMDARRDALLLLDDKYQRLLTAYRTACAASGYSWAEVIEKLEGKP